MEICKCGLGLANTGQEKCPVASVTYGVFGVSLEATDGTLNKIEAAQVLDATYLNERLNDPDASKRWFPIQDLRNVTDVRNDSEFETDSAGNVAELRQGTRPFFGEDWNSTPEFLCQLKGWKCSPFGLFIVDIKGGMVVRAVDDTGDAYPLPVDQNSWSPKLVVAQDANIQKVSISFNWATELDDCELRYIQASNFELNLKGLRGLFDISGTVTATNGAFWAATLYKGYGDYRNRIPELGIVLGDVMVVGTSPVEAAFAPTTWTPVDGVPGSYEATFVPAKTPGTYQFRITRNGRDYTNFNSVDITFAP